MRKMFTAKALAYISIMILGISIGTISYPVLQSSALAANSTTPEEMEAQCGPCGCERILVDAGAGTITYIRAECPDESTEPQPTEEPAPDPSEEPAPELVTQVSDSEKNGSCTP